MNQNYIENPDAPFAPLPRPQYQLRSLPPNMRWEVTRRHPIYQNFWNDVSLVYATDPQEQQYRREMGAARDALLALIGFSGSPISPATEFHKLAPESLPSFMSGTVHPISFRGLAGLLLAYLPRDIIQQIAELFQLDSSNDESQIESLLRLREIQAPILDQYPDELILSVSPTASVRNLNDDIGTAIDNFRNQRNITPRRNREDLYPSYLQVWDLREGWENGRYESGHERTMADIASELQQPLTTINNWYRRAFELVSGHPYSPELWFQLFGPLKFYDQDGMLELGEIILRRPRRSPIPREVDESAISSEESGGILAQQSTEDNVDFSDMQMDLRRLLSANLTDEQVGKRIGTDRVDLIAEYRRTFGDRPSS
ncbi:hypothetical protein [Gimesia sp.]|uniref:hypothetical protein n=1 Tax=Gimesia sp. TaxID=2024833 RepID=UPI003A95AFD9